MPESKAPINAHERGNSTSKDRTRAMFVKQRTAEVFHHQHGFKLTKAQLRDIYTTILGMNRDQLMDVAKDPDLPFWIEPIIAKILADRKTGKVDMIESMFDRAFGKPDQNIIAETSAPELTPFTDDELQLIEATLTERIAERGPAINTSGTGTA